MRPRVMRYAPKEQRHDRLTAATMEVLQPLHSMQLHITCLP